MSGIPAISPRRMGHTKSALWKPFWYCPKKGFEYYFVQLVCCQAPHVSRFFQTQNDNLNHILGIDLWLTVSVIHQIPTLVTSLIHKPTDQCLTCAADILETDMKRTGLWNRPLFSDFERHGTLLQICVASLF